MYHIQVLISTIENIDLEVITSLLQMLRGTLLFDNKFHSVQTQGDSATQFISHMLRVFVMLTFLQKFNQQLEQITTWCCGVFIH